MSDPLRDPLRETRKVALRHILIYGLGDIFGGGSFLLISMFYLFFLTEEVGLAPWLAGIVLGAGKVWDAISDPLMGYLSDHTRSRFGRRRVYFLAGVLPIALSFYLLWIPVRAESPYVTAAFYALAYLVFNTVFTMVMVPYAALGAEMSPDYQVRNKLTAARMLFSLLSAALAGTLPPLLLKAAPSPAAGYTWIAMAFGVLYALPWLVVFAGTWEAEPAGPEAPFTGLPGALKSALSLLSNRSFRIHILMYISAYTAMDVLMILFRYYLKWNIGREVMPQAMGALMGAQILAIPLYLQIANRHGQGRALRVGLVIFASGMALSYFLGGDSPTYALMGVCAVIGAGLSAAVMMPWAILPSVVDVDELITTRARSGMYAGSMTLIRKLVQGLVATQAISVALTLIGYGEGAGGASRAQSPETIARLKILFFALPSAFILLAFLISFRFLITRETHALLREELDRLRRGGDKRDAPARTREILAAITGMPYDALYQAQGQAKGQAQGSGQRRPR